MYVSMLWRTLLVCMLAGVGMQACGGAVTPAAPIDVPDGPALLFFFTDP